MTSKLITTAACLGLGCSIPSGHFIGATGDGGGGSGDGGSVDTPVSTLRRGYILDNPAGIYFVLRDPSTGVLTLGAPTPTTFGGGQSIVVSRTGSHLFAVNGPGASAAVVVSFPIRTDGTLDATNTVTKQIPGCTPRAMALHPQGNWLAIGCTGSTITMVRLAAAGGIEPSQTPMNTTLTAGSSAPTPVFSPNGSCLFTPDPGSARIHALQFNEATGVLIENTTTNLNMPQTARGIAVHPNGSYLYLAGNGQVTPGQINANCDVIGQPTMTSAASATNAVINPITNQLFVAGTEIWGYTIGAGGTLAGLGTLYSSANTIDHATIDPVTETLYFTGRTSGTYPAKMVGATLQIGTAFAPASGSTWFAFTP